MVSTVTAVFLTQIPIAVGILIGAYLLHDVKKDLVRILERLAENGKNRRR